MSNRNTVFRLLIGCLVALATSTALAAEFTPVPYLPPTVGLQPEHDISSVDLSEDGSTVLLRQRWRDDLGFVQAVDAYWSRETGIVQPFEPPTDFPQYFMGGVSGDGSTFVGWDRTSFAYSRAFRMRKSGEIEYLKLPTGYNQSNALTISQDGSVVVGSVTLQDVQNPQNFDKMGGFWNADGEFSVLDDRFDGSFGSDVSANGDVMVGILPNDWPESNHRGKPFRWTESEQVQALSVLTPQDSYRVNGISGDGRWTIGRVRDQDSSIQALRWDGLSTPVPLLSNLEGAGTTAHDITDDGSRVLGLVCYDGTCSDSLDRDVAIWKEPTGFVSLDEILVEDFGLEEQLTGWQLIRAENFSGDGRFIAGVGINPGGEQQAWIVDFGPLLNVEGDYNNNGTVEQADLDLVLLHWGAEANSVPDTWANDLPTGTVDQDELDSVLLGWGSTIGSNGAATAASVPEPTSAWLLSVAVMWVVLRTAQRHLYRSTMLLALIGIAYVNISAASGQSVRDQGRVFGTQGSLLLETDEWSQTITAGITGQLDSITIQFHRGLPAIVPPLTLSIVEGDDPSSGSDLYSQSVVLTPEMFGGNPEPLFGWQVAGANLLFSAGDVFSFRLQAEASGFDIAANSFPGYGGGALYRNGELYLPISDIAFITEVVSHSLTADYNGNGTVEQADLDLVLLNWGAEASSVPETWSNDLPTGTIDQDELDGLLLNWGNTSSPVGAAGVPEPNNLILALSTLVAACLLNRKRMKTGWTR